ncbi:hypothetical protein C8R47DRAFT_1170884 [Mycena vitilis]|nr:hypothetical protein C8R47DRAFT_1170884 [Mycena vitilis]
MSLLVSALVATSSPAPSRSLGRGFSCVVPEDTTSFQFIAVTCSCVQFCQHLLRHPGCGAGLLYLSLPVVLFLPCTLYLRPPFCPPISAPSNIPHFHRLHAVAHVHFAEPAEKIAEVYTTHCHIPAHALRLELAVFGSPERRADDRSAGTTFSLVFCQDLLSASSSVRVSEWMFMSSFCSVSLSTLMF